MLGKASVVKTRNQVKDIPVHQERVFSIGVLVRWLEKMKDRKGNEKANMRILYEIIKVI